MVMISRSVKCGLILWLSISCIVSASTIGLAKASVRWLTYYPYKVQLRGVLIKRNEYGPPGFGESPLTDKKVQVYILVLDEPVNVKANSKNSGDIGTFRNVREVQIIASSSVKYKSYAEFIGTHVTATGELIEGDIQGQYTDVVLVLGNIELSASSHKIHKAMR